MSRKRPQAEFHDYGAVKFKCPDGHQLPPVAILSDGQTHLYGARGAVWLDTPAGGKFKTRCEACEARGVRRDLQASWPKVLEALEAATAPDVDTLTLTLGGVSQ